MWYPELFISVGRYFCPPYWFVSLNVYGILSWIVLCVTLDKLIAVCFSKGGLLVHRKAS
jgi:hypothetical protein